MWLTARGLWLCFEGLTLFVLPPVSIGNLSGEIPAPLKEERLLSPGILCDPTQIGGYAAAKKADNLCLDVFMFARLLYPNWKNSLSGVYACVAPELHRHLDLLSQGQR